MNQNSFNHWRGAGVLRTFAAEASPGLAGLWVALAFIKLGNPIIFDDRIERPANWVAAMFQPWPIAWGYCLFAAVCITGVWICRWPEEPPSKFLIWTPLLWLCWQGVASLQSVGAADTPLISATLPHFAVCVSAFYYGLFVLGPNGPSRAFWIAISGGWLAVVAFGWRQHFGGLAELREYFYSLPNWREYPPEVIAKVASDRIFSTLFYPNTLAGAMILVSPAIVLGAWKELPGDLSWQRLILPAIAFVGSAGCLIWSGSKGGWVIAMGLIAISFVLRVQSVSTRVLILTVLLFGGAAGFWLRYHGYFERGATSVSARFDYWAAAASNAGDRPWFGSGPGTFVNVYKRLKRPDAEMSRLVHNDYLQQATDSGIPGALFFVAFILGAIVLTYGRIRGSWLRLGVWLGILGVAAQSLAEFGLYIPALAWPWFLGMGTLLGSPVKTVDNKSGSP